MTSNRPIVDCVIPRVSTMTFMTTQLTCGREGLSGVDLPSFITEVMI